MLYSQQPSQAQSRKDDHVRLALDQQLNRGASEFEPIRFLHHSLSPFSEEQIKLDTHWAGHTHTLPFYINGMTGGSAKTKRYNQMLAQVAHTTGLAMASGSVSAALHDPTVADSFTIIRKENPNGFVMANLGAHHSLENAQKAVDLLEANALQIHLNVPQEIVMPEGDRDFRDWLKNIETIVSNLHVPVIVKEVGFGMSQKTIQALLSVGVSIIDVAGRGGTNFIQIENERRHRLDYTALSGWGQTCPESLLEAQSFLNQMTVLASGGIQDYFDIVKAIALGANAVGLSGPFLHHVHQHGVEHTVELVQDWKEAIRQLMLMLGSPTISDLQKTDLILSPHLLHWAQIRGLDWQHYSQRSQLK